ncbi:hypothetical protein GCM10009527_003840 [Actinomadura nitritigenes]
MFGWWGGAGVRGRPSKVKGAFGVASRWTSSTLDFGASAAPEAALGAGSACPAPGRATPPPPSVRDLAPSRQFAPGPRQARRYEPPVIRCWRRLLHYGLEG